MNYRVLAGLFGLLIGHAAFAAEEQSAGADGFQRCAACHLASGEGVPGAFPPLKGRIAKLASNPEGRAYLIAVVNTGLMGNISIDGVPYMGVMPGQGTSYDEQSLRDVLNYSVQVIDADNVAPGWQPFSDEEVGARISAQPTSSGMDNARLRQQLISKYPDLQ